MPSIATGGNLSTIEKTNGKFVDFVHLHNHTHYSLLDGLQKVPGLLDHIKSIGQKSVAITDHGTLSGAVEFYKECKKRDLKPIIGMEAYVAPRKHTDKNSKEDRTPYHLILLAKNEVGYRNLMKLSTIACLEGFYYKPRIDRELLEAYHEGLICLSGCIGGEIGTHVLNDNFDEALKTAAWYRDMFGRENYYLEMQPHIGWEPQDKVNKALEEISSQLDIGLVVTGDAHYTYQEDHNPHDILLCVQTGSMLEDPNRMRLEQDLSVGSGELLLSKFPDHPEAIANTVKIAEACDLTIELGRILIPKFDVPSDETEKSYLRKLVFQGAAKRYTDMPAEDLVHVTEEKIKSQLPDGVMERLEYELDVIGRMGYEGYYLIVADLINWSKNQGIVCGPGRGSAAGSIIAYLTNITELDPLKYDLLFERFLNPDRISMPDIDMDYADDRREEVIAYATEKYGQDRVAQIITFGTMAARNAVRDTGRVLGMPYGEVDAIAKLIPAPIQGRHIPLSKSIVNDPDLAKEYKSNPRAKQVIDIAMKLEGTIRNQGTHAAGVVIAHEELVRHTPLTRASKGGVSTQYSMGPIEDLGLLKFDFLGLSNLTIINNTLRIIRRVHGVDLKISDIPIDDKKTYELLGRGDTTGVFQLESAGMKRHIRDLKPSQFEDIIAMVALYRPGPMQWIEDFINRKHNPELIKYEHPEMKAALENTYGVIVYQEQVMQIAKDLCGFTGGQADTLRKGIGKKIPEVLAKMKKEFIDGAIKNSQADPQFVEKLWSSLEDFAAYCFNKSHAACYALIAVQTAYLKAHYPAAFMAALMTSDHENLDRIAIEVTECRKMGIELLPPDINESYSEFAVVPETKNIRFGLGAIKNIGQGPIEAILSARETDPFASIEDFAKRVDASVVNRKTLESLVKSGAFDSLSDRDLLLNNTDKISSYASRSQKNALSGQIDIFGSLGTTEDLPALHLDVPNEQTTLRERLVWEKELLGLYVTSHPLDEYDNYLYHKTNAINTLNKQQDGQGVKVGGIITSFRKITTKNGANMAFVQIENKTGEIELIVFPKAYEKCAPVLEVDSVVEVDGKINAKDREGKPSDEIKVMVDKVSPISLQRAEAYRHKPIETLSTDMPLEDEGKKTKQKMVLRVASHQESAKLIAVKKILENSSGGDEVYLLAGSDYHKIIKLPYMVDISDELVAELKTVVGEKNVGVKHQRAAKN